LPDIAAVRLSPEEIRRILLEEAKKYNQFHPWQQWEDEILREFNGKVPRHIIANKLGRTVSMISHRVEKLGLTRANRSEPAMSSKKQGTKD